MRRADISNYLVHWTKGQSDEDAFQNLLKIVIVDGYLKGGTGYITGKHQCICFTETPFEFFHDEDIKYKPFGIEFSKEEIYDYGGRPVIYQNASELELLPREMEWRHVSYNPIQGIDWVDFTWEREWRLKGNFLHIPLDSIIYVKDHRYARRLEETIDNEIHNRNMRSHLIGDGYGTYPWNPKFDIRIIQN